MEEHQDQHTQSEPAVAEAGPCRDRQQGRVGLVVLGVVIVEVVVLLPLPLLVMGGVVVLLAVETLGLCRLAGGIGVAVRVGVT